MKGMFSVNVANFVVNNNYFHIWVLDKGAATELGMETFYEGV
jgi:hypothetical protein